MRILSSLLFVWFGWTSTFVLAHSATASNLKAPSASRPPEMSYQDVHLNHVTQYLKAPWSTQDQEDPTSGQGAYDLKKPLAELDIAAVKELPSLQDLTQEFEYLRDTQFIESQSLAFARRLSWLYPDDGCYVRAQLAARFAIAHDYKKPSKVFAFGNLVVATPNHPQGQVTWWYHVVIGYRVDGTVYVLDPAVEPERALSLSEWRDRMGGEPANIQFAFCEADAYQPYSNCANPEQNLEDDLKSIQLGFLNSEWDRRIELGRDPKSDLGDLPPWKKKTEMKNVGR